MEGNNVTNLLLRQIDKIPQEEYIKRIRINKMKKKKTDSIEEEEDQHYQNLYTYFLLISFIIIFLDLVITSTNKRLLNKSVQK